MPHCTRNAWLGAVVPPQGGVHLHEAVQVRNVRRIGGSRAPEGCRRRRANNCVGQGSAIPWPWPDAVLRDPAGVTATPQRGNIMRFANGQAERFARFLFIGWGHGRYRGSNSSISRAALIRLDRATNFSESDIARAAHSACRIAGVTYGKDVVIEWQQTSPPNDGGTPLRPHVGGEEREMERRDGMPR